ncbi:MAG: AI-2E family transporter [Candidatus Cryptobacteroides sp.]|nr:AI-2E family transporter [Bacteroidales bacterium]MDD6052914.1 AI-2E family transporter [Bacteroidales bacterium]
MAESNTEKLAGYIITLITLTIAGTICWYFRNLIIYVVLAAVMAMLARPFFVLITRPSIKGRHVPSWLAAVLSILVILCCVLGLVTLVVPVVSSVVGDISKANIGDMAQAATVPLKSLNELIIRSFPQVGSDFRIESFALSQLNRILDVPHLSSVLGSVASAIGSIGVGLFSMIFISFFFIRSPRLFINLVTAFVPDRYEKQVIESLNEIGVLVSRYFTGLFCEVLGVALVNFLGMFIIARLGFKYSIGIAFITGIFNVIPYVGPMIGGIIGVVLALTVKYVCAASLGAAVSFPVFVAMLVAIFVVTQMIDNYLFQPFIYSNSIKAHPLEIFLVFLAAGQMGGMLGMLVAIPAYTVARVFALKFLGNFKPVRRLKGD